MTPGRPELAIAGAVRPKGMRGLAPEPPHPYLAPTMNIFRFFSPLKAFRDFRHFLATRKKHELWMLIPALLVTGGVLVAFYLDSIGRAEWKRPEIIWVKDWRLDRSDAEIQAQQAIDKVEKDKRDAELEKKRKERRDEFKKIDDGLKSWGL